MCCTLWVNLLYTGLNWVGSCVVHCGLMCCTLWVRVLYTKFNWVGSCVVHCGFMSCALNSIGWVYVLYTELNFCPALFPRRCTSPKRLTLLDK